MRQRGHADPDGRRTDEAARGRANGRCRSTERSAKAYTDATSRREVLAHWQTRKKAYRVTLEDGTELVASGDHRFLTNRGWKHVVGAMGGPTSAALPDPEGQAHWIGRTCAQAPLHTAEYRRGYLCGMVRGDGHLGSHAYQRRSGRTGRVHQFRLALTDFEALRRTRDYLADAQRGDDGASISQSHGAAQSECRPSVCKRRVRSPPFHDLIAWPLQASDDWCKGFLAGIFDAEGCHSGCVESRTRTQRSSPGFSSACEGSASSTSRSQSETTA